ncbi:uncharacterized protein C8A04DRAFT_27108 [Dichotomopilus funicola]|uniref:Tse2 ADP-ribosyltransferase toxin domain-containing protein n=1 Tax=Dichotomopilus funicola TaxID=1934379 RepID=A0AAN6V5D6_9PEZI|nr:hypothetical protein C8A04DRAFT_27108 [Dichotomopilus funicola]
MASASKTLLGLGQRLPRRALPRITPFRCQSAHQYQSWHSKKKDIPDELAKLDLWDNNPEEPPTGFQKAYTEFPCTLHYYTLTARSKLFDARPEHHKLTPLDLPPDAVLPGKDELVRPAIGLIWPGDPKQTPISNGVTLLPNTIWMNRLADRYHNDYYLKPLQEGKELEEPQVFTIKKETPVPKDLTLFHESDEWFSLQPAEGMTLPDLNNALDKFYDEYARKRNAEEWFEKNPPTRWIDGREVDVWMDQ